jgi:predicted Zn-dependent protease
MELGKVYRRAGQTEKARQMFEAVLALKPDHKGAQQELAKFLL